MPKHYLLFASLTYAYAIMRPLQAEIRRRGDVAAWYLEDTCPDLLAEDEVRLRTFDEVRRFAPIAVFAPGNWIYDFFPGVKVQLFHGYPIEKRGGGKDTHFRLRGWFDIYCTQGPSSTAHFQALAEKEGYFKVYETGWSKTDDLIRAARSAEKPSGQTSRPPAIFVATTFSKEITALRILLPTIERLIATRDWHWHITMHPKLEDADLREHLAMLDRTHANVSFYPVSPSPAVMASTDAMLCDASSIIMEYMLLDKPVVTYRNTSAGPHLLDVDNADDVEQALEQALTRPAQLMEEMRRYTARHEAHRDGRNCARILDAVDDFIAHSQGRLPRKPLNLFRRLKLRWQLRYFHWH